MDTNFFAYIQQLELLAFFSGYPLVYATVLALAGNNQQKSRFTTRLAACLPAGSALTGTLFLGLELRNLYPDYSFQHIKEAIQHPWLFPWALVSLIFWIPAFGKKKYFSFIHSLIFFLLLLGDLLSHVSSSTIIRNDMSVYSNSLLLNASSLLFITLLSYLFRGKK